jgi:tetratricopeptide (TPR) repeat protein
MSERFLFMPSLGIVLVVARLMTRYIPNLKILGALTIVMVIGLGAKTIDRNRIWKNDFKLFTNDVNENTRSAKLLNAAGGALTTNAASMQDSPQRTASLQKAIGYLEKAIVIHPTYRNAYLLMGNAYYYLRNYENAIAMFDKALAIDPEFKDALQNLPIVLRDGGRHMGQNQNNFVKAQQWLERSFSMNPDDYETCRLLGITYGIQGIHNKAIEFFQKAIALKPNIAANYATLGTAYRNAGQKDKAREAFNKALELDPNALQHLTN